MSRKNFSSIFMKRTYFIYVILSVSLILLIINFTAFAQKKRSEKCKYALDNVNDFTKKRSVETEWETIIDVKKGGFGLSVQDVLDASVRVIFYVSGNNNDGVNGLEFQWGANKYGYTGQFDQVDFLLENGDIVSLKDEKYSQSSHDESWHYETKRIVIADDYTWNQLKNTPLKKIRLLIAGEELKNLDIDKKFVNSIMKVINCIDVLGIPKSETTLVSNQTQDNVSQNKDVGKNFESIQPLGNNSTISLYKQWKCITQLSKDGIPKQKFTNHISRFFEDGSCITYTISENGELIVKKNKFQLVSDNKIIVFTTENGITTSCALTKLTNSELEIKGEIFTNIYIVY